MALVAVPFAWAMLRIATMDAEGDLEHTSAFAQASSLSPGANPAARIVGDRLSPRQQWLVTELPAVEPSPAAALRRNIRSYPERHSLLALPQLPGPAIENGSATPGSSPAGAFPATASELQRETMDRWQIDAWLVLREGSERVRRLGTALPLYGGSQAGVVLRYQLAAGSRHRLAAYLRAVHALGGAPETDLAVGLAARPLANLPLMVHAETRIARRSGGTELRPAAFLTTGIDDAPLPFDANVRGYAQVGYVGGRDPTAFADGSLIAERQVARRGAGGLTVGAGLWGGAQRGAARLDTGPSASLLFPLGQGSGRVAVDYRLRVAGNAEPASSAALTLSAGF